MSGHTPGPWVWRANTTGRRLELVSQASSHPIVMTFSRWGTQSALPQFRDAADDLMRRADRWFVRPESHNPWRVTGINHPDARLIEYAPDLYVTVRDYVDGCGFCNGTGTVDGGRCDECLSARQLLADIDGGRP